MALHSSREQKKHAATRRAQLSLAHAYERIDFIEDVVKPELEKLAEGGAHLDEVGNYVEDAKEALGQGELPK